MRRQYVVTTRPDIDGDLTRCSALYLILNAMAPMPPVSAAKTAAASCCSWVHAKPQRKAEIKVSSVNSRRVVSMWSSAALPAFEMVT